MVFKDFISIILIFIVILSSIKLIVCEHPLGSDLSDFSNNLDSDVCFVESNCLNDKSILNAIRYLKSFGYIQKEKAIHEITTIELFNAFINLQEFAGIERSGRLDQNVIEVMKRKRCSEPDFKPQHTNGKTRKKRSALGNRKWVPFNKEIPELLFNWFLFSTENDTNFGELIESSAQIWMKFTNFKLNRLKELNESHYQNIIFNITDVITNDVEISAKNRETKFTFATNFYYKSLHVTIKDQKAKTSEMKAMLVHIWGHILGLQHSKHNNSIMSPFYRNKTEPYLDRQDIIDIQLLYGPNPNTPESDILYGLNPKISDFWDKTAPNLCLDSKIDSVLEQSDGTWLLFKGKHYFEIGPRGQTRNSPRKIVWDFKNFTSNPIDASLSWNEIVFLFSGNEFWKYRNRKFLFKGVISNEFIGIPDGPFDDVLRWNVNQKTYFFKGGQFWKYDSKKRKVSDGYPKMVSKYWKGIPDSFDAALSSRTRNQTYFFKDTKYYRFDDINKKVVDNVIPPYPRETEIWFAKCRNTANVPEKPLIFRPRVLFKDLPEEKSVTKVETNSGGSRKGILITILVLSLLIIVICGLLIPYLYFAVLKPSSDVIQKRQPKPSVRTTVTTKSNQSEPPSRSVSSDKSSPVSRSTPPSISSSNSQQKNTKSETLNGDQIETVRSQL